jgi:alpha-amylase
VTTSFLRSLIAAACSTAAFAVQAAPAPTDLGPVEIVKRDSGLAPDWAQRGVFAEILVRAYQDGDGDGTGDLAGLTQRLDYLKDLGVTGIWLMPIFKSADRDHGYAVMNYREIEPAYGSLAQFDTFLAEAHKRGIGVIVDYVINHSASDHPLFEDAYDNPKSPYVDWYVFKTEAQTGWTIYEGNPWREAGPRWYFAAFSEQMPDFNLRNPAVLDFHLNNLKFWLNRGVDGFRFDAVGTLVENGPIAWENQPENHVLMKRVQDLLRDYGKRYMVCEVPSDPTAFAAADSCGSAFAFGIQKHIMRSVSVGRLVPELLYGLQKMPVPRMGTFLSNHDTFAGSRIFRQVKGDEAAYRVAAATLLTLPGTPFVYYGEEIGLGLVEGISGGDPSLRGPMSWSGEANAGFTNAKEPFRPNVSNWKTHNVAAQQAKPDSLLNWYKQLIAVRKAEPAMSIGSFTPVSKGDDPIFAFMREHEGTKMLVLINYAYQEGAIDLPADFDANAWKAVMPAGGEMSVRAKALPKPKKGEKAPAKPAAGAPQARELAMRPQQVMIFKAGS